MCLLRADIIFQKAAEINVVMLSGIAFEKQKLSVTFNFDKQGIIDFTKKIQKIFQKNSLFQKSSTKSLDQQLKSVCKMSEKHVRNTKICGLLPNQVHF